MAENIGSGIGGELWDKYKKIIENHVSKNPKVKTVMYAVEKLDIDDFLKQFS